MSSRNSEPAPRPGEPSRPDDAPGHGRPVLTVVGIGASAGGLEAAKSLFATVPGNTGLTFILVQHLDPHHQSLIAELLASHTSLTVREAADGMPLAPDHLYTIPPGAYLSVSNGTLRLTPPTARHGARLPFDHLLFSLAEACGPHAAAIVLSGTGTDGSAGLCAIKDRGGLVIAQLPGEAAFDGMPRSAIATGVVDHVLPAAEMLPALVAHHREVANQPDPPPSTARHLAARLPEIVALLRTKCPHGFAHYKPGTLLRRIERRMTLVLTSSADIDGYIARLHDDPGELEQLGRDLLIHVTSFFRDPKVWDVLAAGVIADLVRRQPADKPLRIWIAGCSTGEEAYTLAILFHEAIAAERRPLRLQIFASDIDPDAILTARDGVYPATIAADLTAARLARNFVKDSDGYRIAPELRASVIFTVQDVLADPPFSRLDLVSCRNMLIYLRGEAQARVIALFHFALRPGGYLLIGNAETILGSDGRFEEVAKTERIYRHVGRALAADFGFPLADGIRTLARPGPSQARTRQTALAELVQRLVVQAYAPAAVLVNRRHECLFSVGPIDRYLRVAPGDPSSDLLAMARHNMQPRLRAALHQAAQDEARVVCPGGHIQGDDGTIAFNISVQPVQHDGEDLALVCFVDERRIERRDAVPASPREGSRVAELEQELETTRTELQGAIRNLELSAEEQKAINEEALSVNEEFQSTNEELLTSKEELQSLNEELTALNTQLQETLERKRTAANDLQNVLYSTDVATIFLDPALNIRLFTPATRALFNIIPTDVGRPLADLSSLSFDAALLADSRAVLEDANPMEREIEAHTGQWFVRRILPYRTDEGGIGGVVITFSDLTERKRIATALEDAKRDAELANVAKSRFLAAASHDLRQPLQTLSLLQGFLARSVREPKAQALVGRLGDTLGAMSGMLNTLLDLNQIEAGTVRAERSDFPVGELLSRLHNEFTYLAQSHGLELRIVPCSLVINSDPRLLEQMLRNLLANAVKYTTNGKVLVGCRRRGDTLSVEIWDTGIGVPKDELGNIFREYHQVDNSARERSRGLGLGLSIVKHLGDLLGHAVTVRSNLGRGSVFAIAVPVPVAGAQAAAAAAALHPDTLAAPNAGTVLVVEDDPELRDLLETLLVEEGHHAVGAASGADALALVTNARLRPDLVLADYNLPNGMNGLAVAAGLRRALRHQVPVIVLTGDTATDTLRDIARADCVHMHKPVRLKDLLDTIQRLLPPSTRAAQPPSIPDIAVPPPATSPMSPKPATSAPPPDASVQGNSGQTVHVVDDDRMVGEAIRTLLEEAGWAVQTYASAEDFLAAYRPGREDCLLLDIYLTGASGLALIARLREAGHTLPVVILTGKGDISLAVQSMKAGALDFIEKPISPPQLLASIARAMGEAHDSGRMRAWQESAAHHVAGLTARQREIMELVLAGHPSKNIAADLGISQRTVENHRASIMKRTATKSLPALARLAIAATRGADIPPPEPPTRAPGKPKTG